MLKEGREKLPEQSKVVERYELPKATGHIQGNKTVINNFLQIADSLRRDEQHFLKYLLRELATPGRLDGPRLVLGRKLNAQLINDKIKQYAETYVLCKDCGKPDTKIIEKEGKYYLKCTACGAQAILKSL